MEREELINIIIEAAESYDDSISFFPWGWDWYDFAADNCADFILKLMNK